MHKKHSNTPWNMCFPRFPVDHDFGWTTEVPVTLTMIGLVIGVKLECWRLFISDFGPSS